MALRYGPPDSLYPCGMMIGGVIAFTPASLPREFDEGFLSGNEVFFRVVGGIFTCDVGAGLQSD